MPTTAEPLSKPEGTNQTRKNEAKPWHYHIGEEAESALTRPEPLHVVALVGVVSERAKRV
jgi:hypothetical protein